MRKRAWGWWGLAAALVLAPAGAHAGVVYLGLPGGRTVAYVAGSGGVTRAAVADLPDVGANALPALGDLDGDGDRDALVGASSGALYAFENAGRDAAPLWQARPAWQPGGLAADAAPALGDVDGDGDLDLLIGSRTAGIAALENVGTRQAPAWRARAGWAPAGLGNATRPALGDVDGDGRVDLVVGLGSGALLAFRGGGAAASPFARRTDWDGPSVGERVAPALGDLDGDSAIELAITDGLAVTTVLRRAAGAWAPSAIEVPDPGSGPAGPAIVPGPTAISPPPTAIPTPTIAATPAPGPTSPAPAGAPVAALAVSPSAGAAPLVVQLDAGGSRDPDGDALRFAWDFGDGTSDDPLAGDPAQAIEDGRAAYAAAKATRDAGRYEQAVTLYLALVDALVPLTAVAIDGPVQAQGTRRIDRVARWYLQKVAHDLGGIYLFHSLGLAACERYATSLQFSRESVRQAQLGGFPDLPAGNGTLANVEAAVGKLEDGACAVPAPEPMFPEATTSAGPVVVHEYAVPGRYVARVTVSDGRHAAGAAAEIVVAGGGSDPDPPTPPPPPPPGDAEPFEGFGAATRGGEGGREIRVREATDAAVRAAFKEAAGGNAQIIFEVAGPIAIKKPLPRLTGDFVTIEGNGATLVGAYGSPTAATIDVRAHDVVVRNLRLRNGGDNLRVQTADAYNVVISHVSSTGAADDGISIGYGAHDVTVQYSFLAGNTRSLFLKYKTTTNVSIHHTWIMKQWIRGPLVSTAVMADLRNLIVEDWSSWGARFEADARGNVVNSLFLLGPYAQEIGGKANSALRLVQSGPVFTAGNAFEGRAADGARGSASAPLAAPPVTTHALDAMIDVVQTRAGCLPRDPVDEAYATIESGWRVGKTTPYRPAGIL